MSLPIGYAASSSKRLDFMKNINSLKFDLVTVNANSSELIQMQYCFLSFLKCSDTKMQWYFLIHVS